MHCRNCKRLRELEEIEILEILRQSYISDFEHQGGKVLRLFYGFRPRIRPQLGYSPPPPML
jgi:hypothetical protein